MIKCTHCEAENLLGAIFCRSCGEKLDIDNLKPDQLQSKKKKAAMSVAAMTRNMVLLLLLIAVVGAIVLAFLPPPIPARGDFSDEKSAEVRGKFESLVTGRQKSTEVNQDEATYAARTMLLLTDEDREAAAKKRAEEGIKRHLVPEDVFVSFPEAGKTHIILKEKLFGTLPIYFTMVVEVRQPDDEADAGAKTLEPTTYKTGWLPMYGPFVDPVRQRFVDVAHEETKYKAWKNQLFDSITPVKFTDDSITITR